MSYINKKNFNTSNNTNCFSYSRNQATLRAQGGLDPVVDESNDEAEKLVNSQQNTVDNSQLILPSSNIPLNESSLNLTLNLSDNDLKSKINQCLKLNAENKINDKNAFQLQMIDFMVYALRKQIPIFTNLQLAGACLDASTRIYGIRVDKLFSDLLKIVGTERGKKRNHPNNDDNVEKVDVSCEVKHQRKRRRKNNSNLSCIESLKGITKTYNPYYYCVEREIYTTEMLCQAANPQHANNNIALNLNKDVILDKISPITNNLQNIRICCIEDFTCNNICPSYSNWRFLYLSQGGSIDENYSEENNEDDNGKYHFNLYEPINTINEIECNNMQDINEENNEMVDDLQEIIDNDSNLDVSCQYSYVQPHHYIHQIKPSYWKLRFRKDSKVHKKYLRGTMKKKLFNLSFTSNSKEIADFLFVKTKTNKKPSIQTITRQLSEENLIDSSADCFDTKGLFKYFLKSTEQIDMMDADERQIHDCDTNSENNYEHENMQLDLDNVEVPQNQENEFHVNNVEISPNQKVFIGTNLITAPRKIADVYALNARRAKNVDMHQLKLATKECLKNCDNSTEVQYFSDIYLNLPDSLSQINSSLAFTSLLHVAHEGNLTIETQLALNDLAIKKYKF